MSAQPDGATAPVPPAKAESAAPDLAALEAGFHSAPGDVRTGLAYGQAMAEAGKREAVLKCFKQNALERPDDRVAAFLLGWAQGKEAGSQAMWTALLARLGLQEGLEGGLVEAWDALVSAEEREGSMERARQALERRLALKPEPAAWVRLGWLDERLANLPAAEQAYRKAFDLDTKDLGTRNALALVLARQKKSAEAQRWARETVKLAPDSATAWIHLGLVLSLAGDSRAAVEAYQQAYEHARGDPTALAIIGASLAELEQFDLAQKALAASLAQDPTNAATLLQSAGVAVQKEDWVEAKRLLALALKADPKNARVAFLQGVVAQRTRQPDAAVNAFRRAVAADDAEPAYALALAAAYLEKDASEQAASVLAEAAQHCPDSAEIQLRLGYLLMLKKRWSPALEVFRRAAALEPKDADAHFYLAVLYGDHLDQPAQAKLHLEEYKRLGGNEPSALAWLKTLEDAAKK